MPSQIDLYRSMLRSGGTFPTIESGNEGLPSVTDGYSIAHSDDSNNELKRIVRDYLDDDPDLQRIADKIIESKDGGLKFLNSGDDGELTRDVIQSLESIVRTDGSRPSFLIRNGVIDFESSPKGKWRERFHSVLEIVEKSCAAVGRINCFDSPQGFAGTGFLIGKNLIMTNRHVLQVVANRRKLDWIFKDGVHIDFGMEFRARNSVTPRHFKNVAFCHNSAIDLAAQQIDHSKLDLVLFELEPGIFDQQPLTVDISGDWADPSTIIFTVGYPGNPGTDADPLTLLEQLFQSQFGKKRIAPGEVISPVIQGLPNWTLSHDATTLAGNSGSCVITMSRSHAAAGLHYGGRNGNPRSNWAHIIGKTLDKKDQISGKTLKEVFDEYGVKTIDRTVS